MILSTSGNSNNESFQDEGTFEVNDILEIVLASRHRNDENEKVNFRTDIAKNPKIFNFNENVRIKINLTNFSNEKVVEIFLSTKM